nr:hypothetical protein [uncultured Roseovarius sp.]
MTTPEQQAQIDAAKLRLKAFIRSLHETLPAGAIKAALREVAE